MSETNAGPLEDPRVRRSRAAEHFGYLAVGALLDEAILAGTVPPQTKVLARAGAGVSTFLVACSAGNDNKRSVHARL